MKTNMIKGLIVTALVLMLSACNLSGGGGGGGAGPGTPQPLGSIGATHPTDGVTTDDTTPLRWDAVTGAVRYEYQLVERFNAVTSNPNDVTTAPISAVDGRGGFGYPADAPLGNGVEYIWRMRAIGTGEATEWTEPATFTVTWDVNGPAEGIRFVGELEYLRDSVANNITGFASGTYRLGGDIDLSTVPDWEPIGTQSPPRPFTGTFDGADFTISGLTINDNTADYQGLFGDVNGGTITRVRLSNVRIAAGGHVGGLAGLIRSGAQVTQSHIVGTSTISGSGNNVGGLVGQVLGSGTAVESSSSSADVSNTAQATGGLVGDVDGGAISNNSRATGTVSGSDQVGGLVGYLRNAGSIRGSYGAAIVSGNNSVGGLLGRLENGSAVEHSYSIGPAFPTVGVSGTGTAGGLVGLVFNGSTVRYSHADVVVSGSTAGGLIGTMTNPNTATMNTLFDSYATGVVVGTGGGDIGGLVGSIHTTSVERSYATGRVQGAASNFGGLVGNLITTANLGTIARVDNGFYDEDTTEQVDTGKGERRTTTAMQTQGTFTGWDFTGIWRIDSAINDGYPYLVANPPQ